MPPESHWFFADDTMLEDAQAYLKSHALTGPEQACYQRLVDLCEPSQQETGLPIDVMRVLLHLLTDTTWRRIRESCPSGPEQIAAQGAKCIEDVGEMLEAKIIVGGGWIHEHDKEGDTACAS